MKRLRKWGAVSIASLMIPALAACSNNEDDNNQTDKNPKTEEVNKTQMEHQDKQPDQSEKKDSDSDKIEDTISSKQPVKGDQDKSVIEHSELSQPEVLQAIKKELHNTKIPKVLPKQLPLEKGKHLTATTASDEMSYHIKFYATNDPVPINHSTLPGKRKDAVHIADLHVKQYPSKAKATEQIDYEDYSKTGAKAIDLGHDIKGYQDAGAGSVFTSWNEGRWAFTARARTTNSEKGEKLAKQAVNYLENSTLPAPNKYGSIHLNSENNGSSRAIWQDGKTVYELNSVRKPMDDVKIVEAFK